MVSFVFLIFVFGTLILSSQVRNYFQGAYSTAVSFYKANGNFQVLRLSDPINFTIQRAKIVIPKDARVGMSPQNWVWTRCKARYALYPFELTKETDWEYFIDFDHGIKNPTDHWKQLTLFRNVVLYAKPGFEFLTKGPSPPLKNYPGGSIFIVFLGVIVFHILVGTAILSLLNISCQPQQRVWYLSIAYLAGYVCLTLSTWLYLLVGGPFEKIYMLSLWGLILVLLIICSKKAWINNLKETMSFKNRTSETGLGLIGKTFLFLSMVLILTIVLLTVLTPVLSWDAMSHWIMKSKVIFHQKALVFDYTGHNEYPILWPLNVAIQFLFAGGTYDELAKWTSAALFLSLIVQLISGLRMLRLGERWIWMLISTFLLCFLTDNMMIAYAENAFYAFFTATMVASIAYFQNNKDKKYFILTVFMAIGLSAVKLEGAIASGIIAFAFASLGAPPFSNKKYWFNALCISSTCLVTGAWIYWQYKAGYFSESIHAQEPFTLEKIKYILMLLPKSLAIVFGWKSFGFFGLFAAFFILRIKTKKTDLEALLLRTAGILILFTVIAFTKWNAAEIPRQTPTLARIFFHALPAMLLYLGCQIKYFIADDQ